MSYFPEPDSYGKTKIRVELDLSINATKFYLKGAAGIDTYKCAKTTDLAMLNSDVDKLDINKLKSAPLALRNSL